MWTKVLVVAVIGLGTVLPAFAGERAEEPKPIADREVREMIARGERFWARDDVDRGVVTFSRGGKNEPLFIWVRGGSKGVFDFRR